jgi:pyruvate kinase
MSKNIICTLGPASSQMEIIAAMAASGMGIARMNFSHGTHQQHQKVINTVRSVNEKYGYTIKVLQDLEGFRIRIGRLKQPIMLEKKQHVWMSNADGESDDFIPLDLEINLTSLLEGMHVFINDGMVCLRVIDHQEGRVELEVENGGMISSRKGVNIPELKLDQDILTAKDEEDLGFGIENNVDYVAQSFVRNKHDILRVIDTVKPSLPDCEFIAKIENSEGIENIESIIDACDGIMIARGDLGVSLPIYQIPFIQKDIIRRCNKKKKFVITATQMLESMTEHPRPTRAEVSDIANAILDGSDYLMLSGETAVGHYPVESVEMMRRIMEFAKK